MYCAFITAAPMRHTSSDEFTKPVPCTVSHVVMLASAFVSVVISLDAYTPAGVELVSTTCENVVADTVHASIGTVAG